MQIRKSNFIVQFAMKKEGRVYQASKSFHSQMTKDILLKKIQRIIPSSSAPETKLRIILIDKKNQESQSVSVIVDPDACIENIKDLVISEGGFFNPDGSQYRILLRNCHSHLSDCRSFCVYSNDSLDSVTIRMKSLIEEVISENNDEDIVFSPLRGSTHRVIITDKDGCGKHFSIKFPNFSSQELRDLLIEKIQGGTQ